MTRSYHYSKPALELMEAGVSMAELARRLNISRGAVSRKLQGDLVFDDAIRTAIEELAGADVLERIIDHLGLEEVPAE